MKIWIVKDPTGKIRGSSIKRAQYAWHPVYQQMPIDVMARALVSIGWSEEEHDIPGLTDTKEVIDERAF